jgi:Flp pilus assembly protein TadD
MNGTKAQTAWPRASILAILLFGVGLVHAAETIDDAELECRENLQALANGLLRSMLLNEGKLPASPSQLYRDGYVSELRQFCCPASKKRLESVDQIDRQTDYELIRDYTDERPIRLVRELHGHHQGQALAFYSDRTFRKVAAPAPPVAPTNAPTAILTDRGGSVTNTRDTNTPAVVVLRDIPAGPATNRSGGEATRLHSLGKEHYANGRWAEAEAALREASRLEPTNTWHHFYLGGALGQQGKWAEAEGPYREAARLNPTYAPAQAWLAHACASQMKWREAEAAYQESIRLDPQAAVLRMSLGHVLRSQAKWSAAEAAFREAARLEPNNAQPYLELGHIYAHQGRFTEAEPPYREVLRLDPNNAWAHGGMGHVRMAQHRWAEAEASYRQAITLHREFGQFHADLAGALFQQGRREEARQVAQEAIRLGFKQHWAYRELALTP